MSRYIIAIMILAPVTLFGQTGGIRGQVTDARTGEPLVGANVVVVGSKPGYGAASDMNGMFLMNKLPPGEYTVRASYVDYLTFTIQNVKVTAGQTTEISLDMRKEGDPGSVEKAVDTLAVEKDTVSPPSSGSLK
jgi:hypothetical protein